MVTLADIPVGNPVFERESLISEKPTAFVSSRYTPWLFDMAVI